MCKRHLPSCGSNRVVAFGKKAVNPLKLTVAGESQHIPLACTVDELLSQGRRVICTDVRQTGTEYDWAHTDFGHPLDPESAVAQECTCS